MDTKDRWDFDKWAESYDRDVSEGSHEEDWVFESYNLVLDKVVEYCDLSKNSYSTILDIGIGTGNLANMFTSKGLKVVGIDLSKEMRKICKRKYPGIQVEAGDFLNIPLPASSVDAIVSSYTFHHLTSEQKGIAVPRMKSVLRANGRIVIADLMFRNVIEEQKMKEALKHSGQTDIIDTIEDEYFGFVDDLRNIFEREGFDFESEQLTRFVWIFKAILWI